MQTYSKKGNHTKMQMINTAKQLFYEYGYSSITIKEICEKSGMLKSGFFYYFKDKTDLVNYISYLVNMDLYQELSEESKTFSMNPKIRSIYMAMAFFYQILADEKLSKFYGELFQDNPNLFFNDDSYKAKIAETYSAFGNDPKDHEFPLLYVFYPATAGSMINGYRSGKFNVSKEEVVLYMVRQLLLALHVEEKQTTIVAQEALGYLKRSKIVFRDIFLKTLK